MNNHLFRYLPEENTVSAENIERIRKIMALPLEAQELTEDELNEEVLNGQRYRESLNTTDGRLAPSLERDRIAELKNKAPDPTRQRKSFASLKINEAIERYVTERGAQVSTRMVAYWREQGRPLTKSKSLSGLRLSKIASAHVSAYQSERLAIGRAPKTVDGEVSVLRQLLKHARLWYRFQEDYKPIPNDRPPAGRALTHEDVDRLFEGSRAK